MEACPVSSLIPVLLLLFPLSRDGPTFHYNAAAALWSLFCMNKAEIELLTNYHIDRGTTNKGR